jgi:ubiquinone/menaquinone biosynthesis C-methylase UbiE
MAKKKKTYRFKDFNDSFDYYDYYKYKTNEYLFHTGNKEMAKIPTRGVNTIIFENLHEKQIDLGGGMGVTIVNKEAVERFHPNHIDNKAFWLRAHESFPLLSVCGGESKSIKQVNELTLAMSKNFQLFTFLQKLIDDSTKPLNVLEIGFGFGNVFNEIKDRCEYIGIDYRIPKLLKKYKNFIEIEKSGIPDFLLGEKYFDVVYSVNVLQHCSQKDRFEYLEQAYSVLKLGGYMIFSCMLMNKANENENYWGIKDNTGRGYLYFFNQLTECDRDYELFGKLKEIGFKPVYGQYTMNHFSMVVQKHK